MLTHKRIPLYFIIAILIISISGCIGEIVDPFPVEQETIIPRTTKVVEAVDMESAIVSISADSSTFVFSEGVSTIDNLKRNDVIVSELGLGILRKVTDVKRENGQVIVSTQQAALTDAVYEGSATITRAITPNDIDKVLYQLEGAQLMKMPDNPESWYFEFDTNDDLFKDSFDRNIGPINISGYFSTDISFTFSIDIKRRNIEEVIISTTFEEESELKIAWSERFAYEPEDVRIGIFRITPITFFIGFVPVVITPNIEIYIGAEGKIEAKVETSMKQSSEFTTGLRYNRNASPQWRGFSNFDHHFEYSKPYVTASASLKGYIKVQLNILLYGLVGPNGSASFFGEIDYEFRREPEAVFYVGIDVALGFRMKVLSFELVNPEIELLSIKYPLWESSIASGIITGQVTEASIQGTSGQPLSNVKVEVYSGNQVLATSNTDNQGVYEISVRPGNDYYAKFTKVGYITETIMGININDGDRRVLETVMQIDENYSGTGRISGTIKNALDGRGVSGLTLHLRRGINAMSGSIVQSVSTDGNGLYMYNNVDAGNYTVEITGAGYHTNYFRVISIGGEHRSEQDATVTPILNQGEIRIILNWGEAPPDLDGHFTGPLPDGGRFHMYWWYAPQYGRGNPWPSIVAIDRDDIYGNGYETITLYQQINGVYRYFVHDYTNRNATYSKALSNSGAQVRVYTYNGLWETFNIQTNQEGTVWDVFEINGSTITTINKFYYDDEYEIQSHNNIITPVGKIINNRKD